MHPPRIEEDSHSPRNEGTIIQGAVRDTLSGLKPETDLFLHTRINLKSLHGRMREKSKCFEDHRIYIYRSIQNIIA